MVKVHSQILCQRSALCFCIGLINSTLHYAHLEMGESNEIQDFVKVYDHASDGE